MLLSPKLVWLRGKSHIILFIIGGILSNEKKVPHRKDIGVITKLENLDISLCDCMRIPIVKPIAENTRQLRIIISIEYGVIINPVPAIIDKTIIKNAEYIPRNAPDTILPSA